MLFRCSRIHTFQAGRTTRGEETEGERGTEGVHGGRARA